MRYSTVAIFLVVLFPRVFCFSLTRVFHILFYYKLYYVMLCHFTINLFKFIFIYFFVFLFSRVLFCLQCFNFTQFYFFFFILFVYYYMFLELSFD